MNTIKVVCESSKPEKIMRMLNPINEIINFDE